MISRDKKGRRLRKNESEMPDGRYRYRYTDKAGKRHVVYAYRLVASDKILEGKKQHTPLRELEKQIERDLEDGIKIADSKMTVNQLIERYLETKTGLTVTTIENYRHMWRKNIKDTLGTMRIRDVKRSDILRFYADLYKNRHFSKNTIQLYQNLLYPAFELCKDDSIIRNNPCKGCMRNYAVTRTESPRSALTQTQVNNLLEYLAHDKIFHYAYNIIDFMLDTGVRMGECIGLTYDDIDFENRTVSINHQVLYRKKDGRINYYANPTKTKKERIIPLSQRAYDALCRQKAENYFLSLCNDFEVDGYRHFVFLNKRLKCHTQGSLTRTFHSIQENYNKEEELRAREEDREPEYMPAFTGHILRHTFCTLRALGGMNPKVLQYLMGHANISVTLQIYTHLNMDILQEEVEKFDKENYSKFI